MAFNILNGNKFRVYITNDGDRWDTIANKAWGDPSLFPKIIQANYGIPLTTSFKGGVKLIIEIIQNSNSTDLSNLPPWKRVPAQTTIDAKAAAPSFINPATNLPGSFDDSFD